MMQNNFWQQEIHMQVKFKPLLLVLCFVLSPAVQASNPQDKSTNNKIKNFCADKKLLIVGGAGLTVAAIMAVVIGKLALNNRTLMNELKDRDLSLRAYVIKENAVELQELMSICHDKQLSLISELDSLSYSYLFDKEVLEYACDKIINFKENVDHRGYNLLMQIIELNNKERNCSPIDLVDLARALIRKGVPVNHQSTTDGVTALMLAALHGDSDMLQVLFVAGVDPTVSNRVIGNKKQRPILARDYVRGTGPILMSIEEYTKNYTDQNRTKKKQESESKPNA